MKVPGEHSSDDVLVDLRIQYDRQLLSDSLVPEARIPTLHFADSRNQLGRWTFRAELATALRSEQQLVLASNQRSVKAHDRRWLEHNRRADQPGRADQCGQQASDDSIGRPQGRCPSLRTTDNQKLMLDEQRFGDDGTRSTRLEQPNQSPEQVNYEAAGNARVWQPTNLAVRRKPLISVPSVLRSGNSHPTGSPEGCSFCDIAVTGLSG